MIFFFLRSGDNTAKLAQVKTNPVSVNKLNKTSSMPSTKQPATPPISKSQINQSQSSQPTSNKQQTQQLVKSLNQAPLSKQVASTPKSNPLIPQLPPSTVSDNMIVVTALLINEYNNQWFFKKGSRKSKQ